MSAPPVDRPEQPVAVGVVFDGAGRVLLTSRPEGKVYAGWWEFPGGKVEAGETVEAALARELEEELGIEVRASAPWREFTMDYAHARVRLLVRTVRDWRGTPEPREGQELAWQAPGAVSVAPLLPGSIPILGWLADTAAP
jgi:8-oxo-dGTP diphosphatase